MQPIRTDPRRARCLDALKILCRIFWGPDMAFCQDVVNGKFVELLQDISDSFMVDLTSAIEATVRLVSETKDAEALCAALSDGYVTLFVNDIQGTPAPLYHSCYQESGSRLMGPPAMDMKNRLEIHGLSISLSGNEPVDHLCIELEYLYYILNKGWTESSDTLIREAVQFAGDSMDGWVRRFYEKITGDGRFPFYIIAGQLLCMIVRILAESEAYDEK